MFAPYCPTCANRVLLGTQRIVAGNLGAAPPSLKLRCFCGTVVDHDAEPPAPRRTAADASATGDTTAARLAG